MIFRIHWRERHRHYHMSVFARGEGRTFVCCGQLTMSQDEFEFFKSKATFIEFTEVGKDEP